MRAFLFSVIALCLIAYGSSIALKEVGFSSAERTASNAVRLPE